MLQKEAGQITGNNNYASYLKGGGEMGQLTRSYDWSTTSLGAPQTWPLSLLNTLATILHSKFPMFLFWGPEHLCFYNDGYRPSLGNNGKHPYALGKKAEEIWPEIWADIKPLMDQVLAGNEGTWSEDQLLPIFRNGQLEDVYWTFSYSPVIGETGMPNGVFVTCVETTEKVNTIKQLQESKDQLQFAIEATDLGTWDLNTVTHKFASNERVKEWFGVPPQGEIDLPYALSVIAEHDRQRVNDAIQNALQYSSGGYYNIEYTIIHPTTKEQRVLKAKGKATFNSEKKATRLNGTLPDVTREAQAKIAILESEQRLRNVVESATFPIGVYVGMEMRILLANQSIIDIFGKGNDVIGKSYKELLPELDNQQIFKQLEGVLTSGIPFHAKNQRVDIEANGRLKTFYFNYSFTPLRDALGNVYGVINTAADVTDINIAKQKLEESEARFRTMAEGTDVMIAVSDETSNAVYFNKAWISFTGRNLQQLLDFGWVDLIHEDDRENYVNIYLSAFEKREPFKGEFRILNKKGEYRWLLAKVPVRFNSDGSFAGYISSCIDITEQKEFAWQLEKKVLERTKELSETNVKLQQSNTELNQFAYIASHDLQEPLRKVRTFAEMMQNSLGEVPEKANHFLNKIKYSAERMQNLINDVLKFSLLTKDKHPFEEVDLTDVLHHVLGDLELLIEQKGAVIKADELPAIGAIPIQMRQLFNNIIANSLKFSFPERPIEIIIKVTEMTNAEVLKYNELNNDKLYYQFDFTDNGIGFNQENAGQIFTMFQRLHGKMAYEGTGIGLAMCKKIVQAHKGVIFANSQLGEGSTFTIILPHVQNTLA